MKQLSTPLCVLILGLACAAKPSADTDATGPIESSIFEMPEQGHILDAAFDETVFFDFWSASLR